MESGPQLACRASKHAVEVYRLSELAQKKRPSHLTHLHRRQVNRKRVFQCHGQILVCKACGRTKLESGCNGRVASNVALVLFLALTGGPSRHTGPAPPLSNQVDNTVAQAKA
ncbi:hypothetical protein L7F22_027585 [Adiantum nelumboides]|nr:hypothetical protein [Adiantum nelumboides]